MEEFETDEVEAGHRRHDATLLYRLSVLEHGEVDPEEPGLETGAPDDVGHLDGVSVLERRKTVMCPDDAAHPFHTCSIEVLRLGADQRLTVGQLLGTGPPPHWGSPSEQPVKHESKYDGKQQPADPTFRLEWDLADTGSGEKHSTLRRKLEGDLGSRVAGTHDQGGARLELLRASVLRRMELADVRVQVSG